MPSACSTPRVFGRISIALSMLALLSQWIRSVTLLGSVESNLDQFIVPDHTALLSIGPTSAFPNNITTGVVIFYHLPKSGGTSIRNFFSNMENIKYARAGERSVLKYENAKPGIERILSGNETDLLFVELHGDIPGLPALHNDLLHWRDLSKANGVPLFALTLIREPIAFHQSYFRFFHGPKCKWWWCERNLYNITVPNFLKAIQPNHQCRELYHGQREMKKRYPLPNLTDPVRDCTTVQQLLESDWDWVGTTGRMQNITLPLLTKVLFGDPAMGSAASRSNAGRGAQLSDLSAQHRAHILKISELDNELFGYWSNRESAVGGRLLDAK